MNRKVSALRRVSASGAPHIVTWTKQTWIKHQCTKQGILPGYSCWNRLISVLARACLSDAGTKNKTWIKIETKNILPRLNSKNTRHVIGEAPL